MTKGQNDKRTKSPGHLNLNLLAINCLLITSYLYFPPGPQAEDHESKKHIPHDIVDGIKQLGSPASQVSHTDETQVVYDEDAGQDKDQTGDFLLAGPSGKEHEDDGEQVEGIGSALHHHAHRESVDGKKRYAAYLHGEKEDGAEPIGRVGCK